MIRGPASEWRAAEFVAPKSPTSCRSRSDEAACCEIREKKGGGVI